MCKFFVLFPWNSLLGKDLEISPPSFFPFVTFQDDAGFISILLYFLLYSGKTNKQKTLLFLLVLMFDFSLMPTLSLSGDCRRHPLLRVFWENFANSEITLV